MTARSAVATVDLIVRVVFRTLAIVEACTWAGLLISMLIKYPLAGSPVGVTVFGWLHGLAWVLFIVACLVAGGWFRWRWWITLTGIVCSVLPFLTVPFDIWMERTGRLDARRPADG